MVSPGRESRTPSARRRLLSYEGGSISQRPLETIRLQQCRIIEVWPQLAPYREPGVPIGGLAGDDRGAIGPPGRRSGPAGTAYASRPYGLSHIPAPPAPTAPRGARPRGRGGFPRIGPPGLRASGADRPGSRPAGPQNAASTSRSRFPRASIWSPVMRSSATSGTPLRPIVLEQEPAHLGLEPLVAGAAGAASAFTSCRHVWHTPCAAMGQSRHFALRNSEPWRRRTTSKSDTDLSVGA
jgi:hypothetical protein